MVPIGSGYTPFWSQRGFCILRQFIFDENLYMRNFLVTVLFTGFATVSPAQKKILISTIDFYGNRKVSTEQLKKALLLSEGELSTDSLKGGKFEARLKAVPGVKHAHTYMVCCDQNTSGWILFVGISENNDTVAYKQEPTGMDSLPLSILSLGLQFNEVMIRAIQQGRAGEDSEEGYALMKDSAARAIQLQFVSVARDNYELLKKVLNNSKYFYHRAFAAQMMAYSSDKSAVINDLLPAIYDANEVVRNNAARALALLADYMSNHVPGIKIPAEPFIKMLNSYVWTDRNKGSMVLRFLTNDRDPELMKQLRMEALPSLVEMAKWKSAGHAFAAYLILGRIAGVKDKEIYKVFYSEKRERELEKWMKRVK